uniref:Extracellular matrix protein 3 n=1 Tax=Talaromyces marneffei PM1 TaxID=1077442 RepID=A0A093US86_TALMA
MSSSDTSSLSSAPPTDDESMSGATYETNTKITNYFKEETPPPPKRAPSPPHEYVLADNPDIAFIVMFRSRFSDVFPKSLPHYGPQDIEQGVQDIIPGEYVEKLLKGHYQRALEEAVQTHVSQWPLTSPQSSYLWSLSSSDAVQAKIKDSYKQARHDDDLNQPLSIQPWGRDELKRRYWLIEGQDDTHFRLYRESNPALKTNTWWSVAGTIDEIRNVGEKLAQEKSQHSKRLSERINHAIPRFEGGEEKRRRRDYRLARKAAFSRPEPGFSLYEGRTRGKKLKYTYSDDEDIFSDDLPATRRSTRNASGVMTPAEPAGPTITASGRQVRARAGGIYGESMLSGQRAEHQADDEDEEVRPQRSTRGQVNGYTSRHANDASDEESEAASSWKGDDESNNENDDFEGDDEEEQSEDESMLDIDDSEQNSLVVHLHYGKTNQQSESVDGPPNESGGIPDSNPVKTEVVTDLSKKPLEKPAAEGGSQAATTTNGSSEEKHQEQTMPSLTAIRAYEYSKENVSTHQDMKTEDMNAKTAQEPPVAPLEPSRMQNGNEQS